MTCINQLVFIMEMKLIFWRKVWNEILEEIYASTGSLFQSFIGLGCVLAFTEFYEVYNFSLVIIS
jgi:hypothetical protein